MHQPPCESTNALDHMPSLQKLLLPTLIAWAPLATRLAVLLRQKTVCTGFSSASHLPLQSAPRTVVAMVMTISLVQTTGRPICSTAQACATTKCHHWHSVRQRAHWQMPRVAQPRMHALVLHATGARQAWCAQRSHQAAHTSSHAGANLTASRPRVARCARPRCARRAAQRGATLSRVHLSTPSAPGAAA